jgi:hypothetical protein
LHEAAIFGHAEVTKLLIVNGADINAWDGYEHHWISIGGESEFATLLRNQGGKTGK